MMRNLYSMLSRFWMASIRRQLILGIALVHAVLMTIFVVDLVDRQSHFLHEQSVAQAEGLAKTIASSSTSWVLSNDLSGLNEVLQSQASFPELRYAMVVNPRGKVMAHIDKSKNGQYFSDDISRRLLNQEATAQTLVANKLLVDVAYPILIDDELIGWARVGVGQEKIAAGLGKITLNGIIYTAIAILIGSIFAYFMAKNLTGGLRHLIDVAEGNRLGRRELRADLQRQDEIGQLGRDFNQMLDALFIQEHVLREHEAELRKMTDILPGPVARVDKDGHYLFVSAAYERWFGKRPDEVIGRTQRESVSAEHYAKVAPYFKRAAAGEKVSFETSITPPGGKPLMGLVTALPDFDSAGKPCGFFVVVADITEQKKTETQLSQSQQQAKNYLEVAGVLFISLDTAGNITLINQKGCEMLGVTQQEILGKNWFDRFLPPQNIGEVQTVFKQLMSGELKGLDHYENEVVTAQGKVRIFAWNNVLLKDDSGRITGTLSSAEDITERRQAEQTELRLRDQLMQATKMEAVGHLTAGIAHDFNNMLGAIMGYTELSKNFIAAGSTAKLESFMDEILKASHRAKELIAQMLTFSRLAPEEKGGAAPVTLLTPVVKEVVSLLRSSIPSSIELNYQIEGEDLKAHILPVNLHQIILNLGINARDAIGEYGKINITLERHKDNDQVCSSCQQNFAGEFAQLTVSDSGTGIAPQVLKNVFDPFFTTKEVGKGTGMGLSVVHGLVHVIGGHIQVHTTLGKGTAISVLLPLAHSTASAETSTLMVKNTTGSLAGLRIMLVDDELFMTAMLQEFLLTQGAHITTFNSPVAAWETFAQEPDKVDLVITDETMPGLSGMHLAMRMMQHKPGLPVILCTGYSDHATPELAAQSGLAGFFYKPLSMQELLLKIHDITKTA